MSRSAGIVYLLDDEPEVVKALGRLLRSRGLEVRGFTSVQSFLEGWRPGGVACLVLDVAMPDVDGLALQERLNRERLPLPIVFLTGRGDIPMSVRAIKAGATDFLTKPVEEHALVRAVDAALRVAEATVSLAARFATLTPREREVMGHVVAGKLNKQIAAALGTGEQNIKVHRARVMDKMQVESLADLVRAAARLGSG